ncbi:autotransporter outer membrane beta-barrel domain-containing protein [Mesorhizobium sp. URHB0026]
MCLQALSGRHKHARRRWLVPAFRPDRWRRTRNPALSGRRTALRSLCGRRLGLSLDHETQWQDRTGRAEHTNLYGIANLYYDFGDGSSVDLAGNNLSSRSEQLWGGLGVGGTINWADDRFSVFGEAVARTGLENFGKSHALTGSLGLRVKW